MIKSVTPYPQTSIQATILVQPASQPEIHLNMKFFATFPLFGAFAMAFPTLTPEHVETIRSWDLVAEHTQALEIRQGSNTRNELQTGGTCPRVILIWARGSTEEGNMVLTLLEPCHLGQHT